MRFINPQKETYHHTLIREFSENSRFMMSGSTKGFVRNRYEWFANFANKFQDNTSFNPNVASVSFFSDHDIFISEYANVESLTDQYPFILAVADSIISGHDHELSTKQYFKISNPHSSFDVIQFINESRLIDEDVAYAGDTPAPGNPYGLWQIQKFHEFYYAPVLYEMGYKIDKGELSVPQDNYNMYIWADRYSSELSIFDYGFKIILAGSQSDIGTYATNLIGQVSTAKRLIDYKVIATEPKWGFIDEGEDQSIFYPFDLSSEQPWSNRQYVGMNLFYRKDGDDPSFIEADVPCKYMPQVLFGDVIERQKEVINSYGNDGRSFFHSSGLSDELDDQSQIIYEISKHQVYDRGGSEYWIGQDTGTEIINGIDVDVERNRRYSAVVSTVPYMTVQPIQNGQVVDYKFVKYDNTAIVAGDFPTTRALVLKIKASRSFMAALDTELNKRELNTDILHTVSIEDPETFITTSLSGSGNYYDFSNIMTRQEYGVEELIDGIVGIGNRVMLQIDPLNFPITEAGYDPATGAKVCGMGYYIKTNKDGTYEEHARLYCSNYVPTGPKANVTNTMSLGAADITVEENELFRPMMKLPGLNGYIKIVRKSPLYDTVRNADGSLEAIYEVEFPFAPGSYKLRQLLESTYAKTQIFTKSSYINAGNQSSDLIYHADGYNARYVPMDDRAFSRIDFLQSYEGTSEDYVDGDPESAGGHVEDDIVSRPINRISYPSYLMYTKRSNGFVGLTKPDSGVDTLADYGGFGTFEIDPTLSQAYLDGNIRMVWAVDNRVWKYGEGKYSSYINRECPSYVLDLDVSSLSDSLGKQQYKYAGVPDIKRWIYSKVVAFCGTTVASTYSDDTHTDGSLDISTQASKSDIMIEIWDSAYPIDISTRAMWRPLTTSLFDTEKSSLELLVSGMHVESATQLIAISASEALFSVVLGKFDSETLLEGLTSDEASSVDVQDNLVMVYVDPETKISSSYHIGYIEKDDTDASNVKIIAYAILPIGTTFATPAYYITPETWVGPASISTPYKKVSRSTDFSFNSCKVVNSAIQNRYLDFGDKVSDDSDFKRYVDSDGIVHIRIRPLKGREFPVSYSDIDTMQWIEDRITAPFAQTNFPWYHIGTGLWDDVFDWTKINIRESVRKFGLNYFSLQSK